MAQDVVIVAHEVHDFGGMERALSELIRGASKRFRFTVISRELSPELQAVARWERVHVPKRPFVAKYLLFFLLGGLKLRRHRNMLVHTQGAVVLNRADVTSIHLCHRAVASVGVERGYGSLLRRLNFAISKQLALFAEQWCYRSGRVGVAAAVSPGVAAEMTRFYPSIDVVVTPNGVDARRFRRDDRARADMRGELNVTDEQLVALFVGGEWARKGLDVALEGVAMARRSGADIVLWVVGRGDEGWLRTVARRRGASGWTFVLGSQVDAERCYQAADIFVLPSAYETFSLAAHEAAACELPVVATRVSGVAELLEAGGGIAVDRDPAQVADALVRLAGSAELRKSLGAAGRAYAEGTTWARSVEAVEALYDSAVSRRRAGTTA